MEADAVTDAVYGVLCALEVTRGKKELTPIQAIAAFTRAAERRTPGISTHLQMVELPTGVGLGANTAFGDAVLRDVVLELQRNPRRQRRAGQPRA